nr:hypothetical protein [Chlamydiota bacterium]
MNYSLIDHTRGYQFTSSDAFYSLATGLSGVPFAKRHYHLSNTDTPLWFAHRMIALIEFLPLLGGLVALVERAMYFGSAYYPRIDSGRAYSPVAPGRAYSPVPWRKEPLSSTAALAEMRKRMELVSPEDYQLPTTEELCKKESAPLQFKQQFANAQGPRPTMEDAHIYKEMNKGVLAAVFDGHGGNDVSAFASWEFEKRFPKALDDAKGNVHQAFENLIHQIHQDVAGNSSWNRMGSTAVISYIDKETHQVYTATLGDSEAHIYRGVRNPLWQKTHSIALSYIFSWGNEYGRLIDAFGRKALQNHLRTFGPNPKGLRSHLHYGVNVSRAIGDVYEA